MPRRQKRKHGVQRLADEDNGAAPMATDSDSEPELPGELTRHQVIISSDMKSKNTDDDMEIEAGAIDQANQEKVEVEFEINALKESDYGGLKALLRQLFWRDMNEHLGQWTELILNQWEYVGSTVKVKDSDDVYGVITCVNLHHHETLDCVVALKNYLMQKCPTSATALAALFKDKAHGLGLIISERVINVPFQLVHPMHSILQSEIQSAVEEDHQPFEFDNYLVLAKTYRSSSTADGLGDRAQVRGAKKKKLKTPWLYVNEEEALFSEAATLRDHYEIRHSNDEACKASLCDDYVAMGREVLVVPAQQMAGTLAKIVLMTED